MKTKLLVFAFVSTGGISGFAQGAATDSSSPARPAGQTSVTTSTGATTSTFGIATALPTDSVVMLSDKLFLVREKESILVDAEVLFPNGIRVSPNGVVSFRNGTKSTLTNNQTLSPEGEGKIVRLPGGYVLPPLAGAVTNQPAAETAPPK